MPAHPSESPAKKQSKWSPEEDAVIIELRGSGMKWEDISKRLPGRSAISCRLHYQNYLERRSEWDEERKNKLARLYERFKAEMWAKVAEEMAIPWRAAEAMHWHLGEADMARRAGVVPFSLSGVNPDSPSGLQRQQHPPPRGPGHSHSYSHGSAPSFTPVASGPNSPYQRNATTRTNSARTIAAAARRDSTPRPVAPSSPAESIVLAGIRGPMGRGANGTGPPLLPSVVEMVTHVTPYNTLAYSVSSSLSQGAVYQAPSPGPGHMLPSLAGSYREGGPVTGPISRVPDGRRSRTPPEFGREGPRRRGQG